MRTFLFIAAAVSLAASAPANAATRNFGINSFEKIRVEGPFKVTLTTGVAPFARASGTPAAIDRVAIDVIGKTLVVHNNQSSWGGYPGKDSGPVEVAIGTHDLSAAFLNGSGTLTIDKVKGLTFNASVQGAGLIEIGRVAVDQLSVGIAGTAGARLAGEAGKMTAVVRGISSLDAAQLKAKDASLGSTGAATISAMVTNSVKVDADGPATVRLTGTPACTLNVRGSTTVSGCR